MKPERMKELRERCNYLRGLNPFNLISDVEELLAHIEAMQAVCRSARALYGDLTADDDEPTHYNSWFGLSDALKAMKEVK